MEISVVYRPRVPRRPEEPHGRLTADQRKEIIRVIRMGFSFQMAAWIAGTTEYRVDQWMSRLAAYDREMSGTL